MSPLVGRLAMVFSPATMVLLASGCFSLGALVTAIAPTFTVFILRKVMPGTGSGYDGSNNNNIGVQGCSAQRE